MVFSGTFSTILMKMQYSVRSEGLELCVDPDTDNMTTLCPFNKVRRMYGVEKNKRIMYLAMVWCSGNENCDGLVSCLSVLA